jgi:hypothetical protein
MTVTVKVTINNHLTVKMMIGVIEFSTSWVLGCCSQESCSMKSSNVWSNKNEVGKLLLDREGAFYLLISCLKSTPTT